MKIRMPKYNQERSQTAGHHNRFVAQHRARMLDMMNAIEYLKVIPTHVAGVYEIHFHGYDSNGKFRALVLFVAADMLWAMGRTFTEDAGNLLEDLKKYDPDSYPAEPALEAVRAASDVVQSTIAEVMVHGD